MDHASLQSALARAASEHVHPPSLHVPWPWAQGTTPVGGCVSPLPAGTPEHLRLAPMKWVRSFWTRRAGVCLTRSCPNQVGGPRGVQQSTLHKEGVKTQHGEFCFFQRAQPWQTSANQSTAPGAYPILMPMSLGVIAPWAVARAAALPTARPRGPHPSEPSDEAGREGEAPPWAPGVRECSPPHHHSCPVRLVGNPEHERLRWLLAGTAKLGTSRRPARRPTWWRDVVPRHPHAV